MFLLNKSNNMLTEPKTSSIKVILKLPLYDFLHVYVRHPYVRIKKEVLTKRTSEPRKH